MKFSHWELISFDFLDNGLVLNRQQAIIQNYNDPLVYRVQWKDNQYTICCFYAYWREK